MNAPLPITRHDWQLQLEDQLRKFCPDVIEAQELLCAWLRGLRDRYDDGILNDVLHEHDQLFDALDELSRTLWLEDETRLEDERHDDQLAREAGL